MTRLCRSGQFATGRCGRREARGARRKAQGARRTVTWLNEVATGLPCPAQPDFVPSTSMRVIPFLVIAALLAGCRKQPLAPGVSDSAFVRAMAGLRRLPTGTTVDHLVRDRMRDSILRANGVTGPQLESAASALASDPDRAAAIWRAIDGRPPNSAATPAARPAPR